MTATAILDLERAGFTREQVEALARWHETGIDLSHLATKADLATAVGTLDTKIAEVRRELAEAKFDLVKWVVGFGIVQLAGLIGLAFTILKLFPGVRP